MKKLTSILFVISIIIAVLVIISAALIILRGNEDTWICSNGLWVEHGHPSAPMPDKLCPGRKNQNSQACTMEAKICPDGSAVGRSGANCEFAPCPATSTAHWKTYSSDNYGFSFKYPNGFTDPATASDTPPEIFLSFHNINAPTDCECDCEEVNVYEVPFIDYDVSYNKLKQAEKNSLSDSENLNQIGEVKKMVINNQKALSFETMNAECGGSDLTIDVFGTSRIIRFSGSGGFDLELLTKIVNTFKFTK